MTSTLLKLWVVVFLDMFVAIGIALAVLPFYLTSFGASAQAMGISMMLFSALQFLLMPVWGGLSDRHGRKRIMMIQQLGAAAGVAIVATAARVEMVFVGRAIAGAFGGTMMLTSAYITDVTPVEKRTRAMGIIGIALMAGGLMVGPAVGGALSSIDIRAPFYVGIGVALVNFLFVTFVVSEPAERTSTRDVFSPSAVKRALADTRVRSAILLNALTFAGIAAFQTCFTFYVGTRFGLKPEQAGPLLAILGVTGIIAQASVGALGRRFGEWRVVVVSGVLVAVSSLGVSNARSLTMLIPMIVVFGFAQSSLIPTLLSVASIGAPSELRGTVLGFFYGMQSLVLVIAPPIHGALYDNVGISAPFVAATLLFAFVSTIALLSRTKLQPAVP